MTPANQLLKRMADQSISHDERVRLRCRLAKELEETGNYEGAREAFGELWTRVDERPALNGLEEATAAEVLLRVGTLTGWIGSVRQIEDAQEIAKNLISESLSIFEGLQAGRKRAEAQTELAYCYWRQGAFDEARVILQEVLCRSAELDERIKAVALIRSAIVERSAKRFNDAFRFLSEAAPLVAEIGNDTSQGKFHNQFATILENLGRTEHRSDYIDRALIEYSAASYHFEQAGHRRYQACVENNLGFLFCTIGKYDEAHEHLNRARALFTSLQDNVHLAQVDETRARVFLAEGRVAEAARLVRAAVRTLERGGEQSLLAEARTTYGVALARLGRHAEALAALRQIQGESHFDVFILDYNLPGLNGVELTRRVRRLMRHRHAPVIMLTASEVEKEARRAGVSAFLSKPCGVTAITETVARLLARQTKQG
jgi:CheY-like chemotaxis protein